MAGGVQHVDERILIGELHGGRGDRDPPFLLHRHPVGSSGFPPFAPFDHPGRMDHAGIEEKLFGQGGFPRVGVADDGEGASFGNGFPDGCLIAHSLFNWWWFSIVLFLRDLVQRAFGGFSAIAKFTLIKMLRYCKLNSYVSTWKFIRYKAPWTFLTFYVFIDK